MKMYVMFGVMLRLGVVGSGQGKLLEIPIVGLDFTRVKHAHPCLSTVRSTHRCSMYRRYREGKGSVRTYTVMDTVKLGNPWTLSSCAENRLTILYVRRPNLSNNLHFHSNP